MVRKKILAIIPAKQRSRGVPGKNVKVLLGKPLIWYTIRSALKSKYIDRIVVSTDSEKIAKISKENGAEVPCLRPKKLARDDTPVLPVLQHMIEYLEEKEGYSPFAVLILQPTSPLRTEKHIDDAIKKFLKKPRADSLVSVMVVPHNFHPKKLMKISGEYLIPYLKGEGTRILTREGLPKLFARNGPAILITKTSVIKEKKTLYGKKVIPYLMSKIESFDIDDLEDWKIVESVMKNLNRI